jgi:hypothetical protein
MLNKKHLLICTLSLVVLIGFQAAAETFQYRESVERKGDIISRWIIENDGDKINLTVVGANDIQNYVCANDGSVVEFGIKNNDGKTDFTAIRNGNTVKVYGRINGRKVSAEFTVEDIPWGQPIPILLQEQFTRTSKGLDFWILNVNKLKPIYLKAHRKGIETVQVIDREFSAYHFEIRLRGALSAFWVSNYWLHAETRDFIKFQGDYGPGSPETIMQLMRKYD